MLFNFPWLTICENKHGQRHLWPLHMYRYLSDNLSLLTTSPQLCPAWGCLVFDFLDFYPAILIDLYSLIHRNSTFLVRTLNRQAKIKFTEWHFNAQSKTGWLTWPDQLLIVLVIIWIAFRPLFSTFDDTNDQRLTKYSNKASCQPGEQQQMMKHRNWLSIAFASPREMNTVRIGPSHSLSMTTMNAIVFVN